MNKNEWLPWSQLMSFGFGRLQLSSTQFWAMTLKEIDAAIAGHFGERRKTSVPSKETVNSMMQSYPDNLMGMPNE